MDWQCLFFPDQKTEFRETASQAGGSGGGRGGQSDFRASIDAKLLSLYPPPARKILRIT